MVVTGKSGHLPSACQFVCNIVLNDLDRGRERNKEQVWRFEEKKSQRKLETYIYYILFDPIENKNPTSFK